MGGIICLSVFVITLLENGQADWTQIKRKVSLCIENNLFARKYSFSSISYCTLCYIYICLAVLTRIQSIWSSNPFWFRSAITI